MNTTTINVNTVINNRKAISVVGGALGTQYFKASARAAWPDFDKEAAAVKAGGDADLILNRTPRRYRLRGTDVYSMQIGTDGSGSTVVFINKDSEDELVIPISADMTHAGIVTEDAVGKALRGDSSIFFQDPKKLAKTLNNYNLAEKQKLEGLRKKIDRMITALDSTIKENEQKAEKFITELTSSNSDSIPSEAEMKAAPAQENTHIVIEEA